MATANRIIVAGSRGLNDYAFFRRQFIKYLASLPKGKVEVITGRAPNGPDDMAYHFCKWDPERPDVILKEFKADWDEYGKRAGYLRNVEMAKYGRRLFCMYDGKSPGSKHMIKISREEELQVKLYVVEPPEEPISEILHYRL